MKEFKIEGFVCWVGKIPNLGPVIYDEASQIGLDSDKVRLFKVNQSKSGTFVKSVRDKIVNMTDEEFKKTENKIKEYCKIRKNQRVTHCYNCAKKLTSVDFSICSKCTWIKCSCGACGCGYSGWFY